MKAHTAQMSNEQLARVWAAHHGVKGNRGGWFTFDGVGVADGWRDLADVLVARGAILPGRGIDWAAGITPKSLAASEIRRREYRAAGYPVGR